MCFRMAAKHATVQPPSVPGSLTRRLLGGSRHPLANGWKPTPGPWTDGVWATLQSAGDRIVDAARFVWRGASADAYYGTARKKRPRRVPKRPFRPFSVYLGDSTEVRKTGGGGEETIRTRNDRTREVEVIIDSKCVNARVCLQPSVLYPMPPHGVCVCVCVCVCCTRAPILVAVLKWLEQLPAKQDKPDKADKGSKSDKSEEGETSKSKSGKSEENGSSQSKSKPSSDANGDGNGSGNRKGDGKGDNHSDTANGSPQQSEDSTSQDQATTDDGDTFKAGDEVDAKATTDKKKKKKPQPSRVRDDVGAANDEYEYISEVKLAQAASSAAVKGITAEDLAANASAPPAMSSFLDTDAHDDDYDPRRGYMLRQLASGGADDEEIPEVDWVKERIICIHTSSRSYFHELADVLAGFGACVHCVGPRCRSCVTWWRAGITAVDQSMVHERYTKSVPCLFYFPMTEHTARGCDATRGLTCSSPRVRTCRHMLSWHSQRHTW